MAVDSCEHTLATLFTSAVARITWEATVSPFTPTPDLLLSHDAIALLRGMITKVVGEFQEIFCLIYVNMLFAVFL